MKQFSGLKFKQWPCDVRFSEYDNGRIAILLESRTEGPIATASVNVVGGPCEHDEVYVKDYSENEGMATWLAENHIIHATPVGEKQSGYVTIKRYKLMPSALECIKATL